MNLLTEFISNLPAPEAAKIAQIPLRGVQEEVWKECNGNGSRIGAMKTGVHFVAERTHHSVADSHDDVVVGLAQDAEASKRMRVIVRAVPRIQSVADDVRGFAGGVDANHAIEKLSGPVGKKGRRRLCFRGVELNPRQNTVVVCGEGGPRSMTAL